MDCSKTINFLHELQRLCDSRDVCEADAAKKEGCPMLGLCDCSITTTCAEDVIRAVENLQKWSDEHSQKTYIQDFLEKLIWTEPRLRVEKNSTAEYARTIEGATAGKLARTAGTSQWRDNNARNKRCSA